MSKERLTPLDMSRENIVNIPFNELDNAENDILYGKIYLILGKIDDNLTDIWGIIHDIKEHLIDIETINNERKRRTKAHSSPRVKIVDN